MTAGSVSPRSVEGRKRRISSELAKDAVVHASAVVRGSGGLPAAPTTPPPFTLGQIRAAIPEHCFERNSLTSLSHVAKDLLIAGGMFYAATFLPALPLALQVLLWPVYWYACGAVLTGVWVIAHECGHGAFSAIGWLNDLVGWVLHSILLVPYFSWKYTHAAHHMNTNSCENDEVFVPTKRSELTSEMLHDSPLANGIGLFAMLTIGWPGYLIFNSSGPAKYAKSAHKSHFHPFAALFRDSQRLWIAVSDVGFFAMIAALVWASRVWGFGNVFFYYGVPYLVVNAHLVLITFLQHTDTYVPHYREGEFTWLRGALCTVDRSYGWLLDAAFHHITDTHVAHHLFSHMPWYHAEEATAAMKGLLGPFYLKDDTPIPAAAYRAWSQCRFVEDTGDVLFFQSPAAARKSQ